MGYGIHVDGSGFRLRDTNLKSALFAIKAESARQRLDWTEPERIARARTIFEALDELGYNADIDQNGDIVNLSFEREKIGDEERWLGAIAPFVEAGSYLHVVGEDADQWRWVFDGSTLTTKHARVVFDDDATPAQKEG